MEEEIKNHHVVWSEQSAIGGETGLRFVFEQPTPNLSSSFLHDTRESSILTFSSYSPFNFSQAGFRGEWKSRTSLSMYTHLSTHKTELGDHQRPHPFIAGRKLK